MLLGGVQGWYWRDGMNPDGISYLDLADAWAKGNWGVAINAHWSPLYSWVLALASGLLHPGPYWEFPVVKLANFAIYLAAWAALEFFVESLRVYQVHQAPTRGASTRFLSYPIIYIFAFLLFVISISAWLPVSIVTPDILMEALLFLSLGCLYRVLGDDSKRLEWYVLFGGSLGLAYLSKTIMYAVALVLLLAVALLTVNQRGAIAKWLLSICAFLLVAGPFIFGLSRQKGYLTFGTAGSTAIISRQLSCASASEREKASRDVMHAPRCLMGVPQLLEFRNPIPGTFPLHYDPSYWDEGRSAPPFSLGRQYWVLAGEAPHYRKIFCAVWFLWPIVLLLLVLQWHLGGFRSLLRCLAPALAILSTTLLIYAFAFAEPRYIGPFLLAFLVATLASISVFNGETSAVLETGAVATVAVLAILTYSYDHMTKSVHVALDAVTGRACHVHYHEDWRIAEALKRLGVEAGEQIAVIGDPWTAYWARLTRVHIIACLSSRYKAMSVEDQDKCFGKGGSLSEDVIKQFKRVGVKTIVAEKSEALYEFGGWHRLGQTDLFALVLPHE